MLHGMKLGLTRQSSFPFGPCHYRILWFLVGGSSSVGSFRAVLSSKIVRQFKVRFNTDQDEVRTPKLLIGSGLALIETCVCVCLVCVPAPPCTKYVYYACVCTQYMRMHVWD